MIAGIQPPRSPAAASPRARTSMLDRVQMAAVFYISAWAISPPLFVATSGRIAALVALGLWAICELTRRNGIFLRPTLPAFIAALYMIFTAVVIGYADGSEGLISRVQVFIFMLFLLFFESARRQGLTKYRPLLWGGLILLPIWMAITVNTLGSDSHAARTLVRSTEESLAYQAQGVGGYGLVYTMVLAVPAIIYVMANLPWPAMGRVRNLSPTVMRRAQLALLGVNVLLAVVLISRAGYSIAFASLALGLFTYVVLRGRSTHRPLRIGLALVVAVVGIAISQTSIAGSILDTASDLAYGTSYRGKIEDVRASMEMDSSVGSVYSRTERYVRSIVLFFENPLIGTLSIGPIGKHSAVLDNFAQFGFFGGVAFLYLLFYVPVKLIRASTTRPEMTGPAFAFTFMLAICVVFNDIVASMGFVVFLLCPLAMTYLPRPDPAARRAPTPGPRRHPAHPPGARRA